MNNNTFLLLLVLAFLLCFNAGRILLRKRKAVMRERLKKSVLEECRARNNGAEPKWMELQPAFETRVSSQAEAMELTMELTMEVLGPPAPKPNPNMERLIAELSAARVRGMAETASGRATDM